MKDVSADVKAGIRDGRVLGFMAGLRKPVFTEMGNGAFAIEGALRIVPARDDAGGLMVEQDTTSRTPAESAATSRAMLRQALAHPADAE